MSAEPLRPHPPHVITRAEVATWLADSAVKTVTFHRTSPAAARAIVERGVRVEHSRIGSYGQGFYTTTEPDEFYGGAEVTIAVRSLSPLVGSMEEVDAIVDRLVRRHDPRRGELSPRVAAAVRRDLLANGYDGLVVRDGDGDGNDLISALRDDIVRVVIDA